MNDLDIKNELHIIQRSIQKLSQHFSTVDWHIQPCPFCKGHINGITFYSEPINDKLVQVIKCDSCNVTMTEKAFKHDIIQISEAKIILLKRWNSRPN
jgi:hypothetical protein